METDHVDDPGNRFSAGLDPVAYAVPGRCSIRFRPVEMATQSAGMGGYGSRLDQANGFVGA